MSHPPFQVQGQMDGQAVTMNLNWPTIFAGLVHYVLNRPADQPPDRARTIEDVTVRCMGCDRTLDGTKGEAWHAQFCIGERDTTTVNGFIVFFHCCDCDPWKIAEDALARQLWPRPPNDAWKTVQGTS